MNLPAASMDTLIRDIIETMRLFGRNRSKYPFDLNFHDGRWWVTIELDTSLATADFETKDADPLIALTEALTRLRREGRISGALKAA